MRLMYDSVNPPAIPQNAAMVAGYVNGPWAWTAAEWELFPHAAKVQISVRANFPGGHVLDVEPGDATPAEAPSWVFMRRQAGLVMPTIYCNLSTWPTVRNEFLRRRMPEPQYWIAHYDGQFNIPPGAIAKQYLPNYQGTDHSAVADFWPGVDAALAPVANGESDMLERRAVVPTDDGTHTTRVWLSGTATAGIVIRPRSLDKDGFQKINPVFVGNIYAWGSDHQGIGHNPTQTPGYNNRVESHRRIDLPGAVWADIEWSSHAPFDVDCF
jgi:hypothetical protein